MNAAAVDWRRVHDSMRPRVRAAARRVLRDEHEAEDAVQDTFLRAWCRIGNLREPRALPGWLLTLARRSALDRCRRDRRFLAQVGETALEDPVDGRELPPVDVLEVAEAYARLPAASQRALDQELAGLTLEEFAAAEGISLVAAKTRRSRARARLRAMVRGSP